MRWLALKSFIIASSCLFSFSSMAETIYPLSMIDGLGNSVVIEQEPKKISSKSLFTDAVLLELVDESSLSSLTEPS